MDEWNSSTSFISGWALAAEAHRHKQPAILQIIRLERMVGAEARNPIHCRVGEARNCLTQWWRREQRAGGEEEEIKNDGWCSSRCLTCISSGVAGVGVEECINRIKSRSKKRQEEI